MKIFLMTSALIFCLGSQAATFQITGRTIQGDATVLPLDATLEITFTVSASGMTHPVVPSLSPSPGTDPLLADALSITWNGESALAPWSGSNQVTFLVHLYEEPNFCGDQVSFTLSFANLNNQQVDTASAISTSLLEMPIQVSNSYTLEKQILSMVNQYSVKLFAGNSNTSGSTQISGNFTQAEMDDQNNRIFMYVDYALTDVQNRLLDPIKICNAFSTFTIIINNAAQFCRFNWPLDLFTQSLNCGQDLLVTGAVTDATGATPVAVPTAPIGGAGTSMSADGQGVNFFDISDIVPNSLFNLCPGGATIREILPVGGASIKGISATMGPVTQAYLRDIRFYIARLDECAAAVSNFGSTPSSDTFYIKNVHLTSAGHLTAELEAPAFWKSGANMAAGFTLTWIFRTPNSFTKIPVNNSSSRFLDGWLGLGEVTDPSAYWIEVRVEKDGTQTVSTSNLDYNHQIDYSFPTNALSFEGAEVNFGSGIPTSDDILDPGELVNFAFKATSSSASSLPQLTLDSGFILDANSNGQVDASDSLYPGTGPIAGNYQLRTYNEQLSSSTATSKTYIFPFDLLAAPAASNLWFYIDVQIPVEPTGNTSRYTRIFSLRELMGVAVDLNAEDSVVRATQEGTSLSAADEGKNEEKGWDPTDLVFHRLDNLDPAMLTGSSPLFAVETQLFPLGEDTYFSFTHTPKMWGTSYQGTLEYQIVHDRGHTDWASVTKDRFTMVPDYESLELEGPENAYLTAKPGWTGLNPATRTDTLVVRNEVARSFFKTNGKIRFRFLVGSQAEIGSAPATPANDEIWSFQKIATHSKVLLVDNLFELDTSKLTIVLSGDPLELTFLSNPPVNPSALSFTWYESLEQLYQNDGTGPISGTNGMSIPFIPPYLETVTYYVRLSHSSGAERIWRVTVDNTDGRCFEGIEAMLHGDNGTWGTDQNVLGLIALFNSLCIP